MMKFPVLAALTSALLTTLPNHALAAHNLIVLYDVSQSSSAVTDRGVRAQFIPMVTEAIQRLRPTNGSQVVVHGFGDDTLKTDVLRYSVQTRATYSKDRRLLGHQPKQLAALVAQSIERYASTVSMHGRSSIVAAFEDASEYCQESCEIMIVSDGVENGARVSFTYQGLGASLPMMKGRLKNATVTWYGFGDQVDDQARAELRLRWNDFFANAQAKSVSMRRW